MTLRYLSVCSGIEAASVAWHALGWKAYAVAEIEAFPCAVLKHHYHNTPNLGDMTKFRNWPDDAAFDVLVGGTPCQSFSVAGLRKGMADPRGNLALTYLAIADKYRPEWIVWENVPGVLSSGDGRDFGSFLGGLQQLGYGFAYRVLDAQYFGLAQRRQRVFVVGYLGDWRRAAAVLFERESLRRDSAPSRQEREGLTHELAPSLTGSGRGVERGGDTRGQDPVVACFGGNNTSAAIEVATAVNAHGGPHGRLDFESETFITHSLRADGFDASEDGTGRGTPLVPIGSFQQNSMGGRGTLGWNDNGEAPLRPVKPQADHQFIAFSCNDHGTSRQNLTNIAANRQNLTKSDGQVAVAVALRGREGGATAALSDVPSALRASSGGGDKAHVLTIASPITSGMGKSIARAGKEVGVTNGIISTSAVRRLTPRECERLQGFPDDYTLVTYRGKPASDGPRYKALGNSMAVPVMSWIGTRIQMVNAIASATHLQAAE